MENSTLKQYNNYIQHLSSMLKINSDGSLVVVDLDGQVEQDFFKRIELNPFFNLINIIKTNTAKGTTLGLSVPMPSQTNTNIQERTPESGHISPPQAFHCEQINLDSYISYQKLDSLAGVLDVDFNKAFEDYFNRELFASLLMVGWNGKNRATTSDPKTHKLAEDVKKGWLQLIKEKRQNSIINGANVGENQPYKSLSSLVKAGLEKIENPIKSSGDLIAICGRNVLADYPIVSDISNPIMTVSQKQIGGLKAVNIAYFPENSILITCLDNLSLYIQKGTIRKLLERNSMRNRLDVFTSLALDFVIEDYNAVALIENINLVE